jgi:beta-xylosidase
VSGTPVGAQAIDPYVFIDDDGQAYLYFGGARRLMVARLAADMTSFVGSFTELTPSGYVEGPAMNKRRGIYYLMWSEGDWTDASDSAAYAMASSPLGPFSRVGRFLESNPSVGNGAGHNSVVNVPGTDEWYVAYHRRPVTEGDPNHRVTCIDRLTFNADGTIVPVTLTTTGVAPHPL